MRVSLMERERGSDWARKGEEVRGREWEIK